MNRRLAAVEERLETLRLVLTGDLRTVGLIENVRNLTNLVGDLKDQQEVLREDLSKIKQMERTRTDIRLGEEKAGKRLRRFLYIIGTLMLGGSGTIVGLLGRLLATIGQS